MIQIGPPPTPVPCPFCGAPVARYHWAPGHAHGPLPLQWAACDACGAFNHNGTFPHGARRWWWRARLHLEPRDAWIGLFWKRDQPWRLDLFFCAVPFLPLHIEIVHYPEQEATADA